MCHCFHLEHCDFGLISNSTVLILLYFQITQSLKVTWHSALKHCSIDNSSLLSTVVFKAIENYFESKESNDLVLKCLIELLITVSNFNNGQYIDAKECLMVYYNITLSYLI